MLFITRDICSFTDGFTCFLRVDFFHIQNQALEGFDILELMMEMEKAQASVFLPFFSPSFL